MTQKQAAKRKLGDHWYPKGTLAEPYLPQEISKAQQVFPAGVGPLMPPADDIPEPYQHEAQYTKWGKLFSDMFYVGISDPKLYPKPGIDPEAAWTHVTTIMGSYEPKHEFKMAACSYLLSLWFEDATWETKKRDRE